MYRVGRLGDINRARSRPAGWSGRIDETTAQASRRSPKDCSVSALIEIPDGPQAGGSQDRIGLSLPW